MKYLHTMVRVSDVEESLGFYNLLGLREIRRHDNEKGRFTLVYLAAPGNQDAQLELTWNWDEKGYDGGRRRSSCGHGSRGRACARGCWAGRCAWWPWRDSGRYA